MDGTTTPDLSAEQGDLVIKDSGTGGAPSEFIWDGGKWSEFGAGSALKSFAFTDKGTVTLTSYGTADTDGALTVDFSQATLGSLDWSGVPTFSGAEQNVVTEVTNTPTNLVVEFSNASVSLPSGLSTNATLERALTGTSGTISLTSNGETNTFTRLTGATSGTQTVISNLTGSNTAFSGKYTPAGSISANAGPFVTDVTIGTLAPTGEVSLTDVKPTGTISLAEPVTNFAWNDAKPSGTVSKPDITVTSGTKSFLTAWSATVSNTGVLSFSSGADNALTSASAALDTAPEFTGKGMTGTPTLTFSGWSGNNTFSGTGLVGTATFTNGGFTGTLNVTSGSKAITGTKFSGTEATINVSGTPQFSASSGSITYIKSVTSGNAAVTVTVSGTTTDAYLKTVFYSGTATKASVVFNGTKSVAATGTQTLTYQKASGIVLAYKPSGEISVDAFKVSGTLAGTQAISGHTHSVTVSGTSNNVTPYTA